MCLHGKGTFNNGFDMLQNGNGWERYAHMQKKNRKGLCCNNINGIFSQNGKGKYVSTVIVHVKTVSCMLQES